MNMRENLEQAYEAGRAAGILEMANRERIISNLSGSVSAVPSHVQQVSVPWSDSNVAVTPAKKRRGRIAKAADAPKEPKAPKVARGVKRASTGPRTKGVKEAIVNLIGQRSGIAVADIVSQLGFKETSVRATLMGLKKAEIAAQDDEKNWYLTANAIPSSNSEYQSDETAVY